MKKFLVIIFTCLYGLYAFPRLALAEDFSVSAKHAVAVDVASGKILYEKDAQIPASIGSITSLLTVYLIFEAIEEGQLSMDSLISIGDYPYSLTGTVVNNVNLDARSYTVEDLLKATLISSANSSTIALAEAVAGNEPAFVDKMKAKLAEWGITDAKLVNSSGLNNSYLSDNLYPNSSKEDENQLSAMDVAAIARRLILDYPQVLKMTSQYSYNFQGYTYTSTNQMLAEGTYKYPGVDGLKTGAGEKSGTSFVATIQQNNMRILTVVLDANDSLEYPDNRFSATNELIKYIYNTFTLISLVEKDESYQSSNIEVFNGQTKEVKSVATKDLNAIVRKGDKPAISAKYSAKKDILNAPVQKGQVLGTLTLVDKDLIGKGYLETQPSVDMVTAKDISAAPWPVSWWNHFVRYVNEKL